MGRVFSSLLKLGVIGAVILAVLLALGVVLSMLLIPSFDELKRSPNGQTIMVKASDGTLLHTVGPSYGEWLPLARMPDVMEQAMVSVEDRRFYGHAGIDPRGIAAAARDYVTEGRVRGASTITQQLARNLFLTNERSFARKLREAVLALALEQRFSKDQILELYLNRVYFGGGAYGVDAASRRFFGHPATRLELAEAAIIAGLVKAPSRYAPSADPERARDRAEVVLAVMEDTGAATAREVARANVASIVFAPEPKANNIRYFTDWALEGLDGLIDETVEPLEVVTTLDARMQSAAEQAVRRHAPAGAQGALIAMTKDGAVRALVGGKDYVRSNYNRAVTATRQPGSAFKLFVYLTALEDGVSPQSVYRDAPVTVDGWSPRNYDRRYRGEVTVRDAFAASINTVAVQLADEAGYDRVARMAERFGIRTPIDTRPAMALGTSDVRLIELTTAYAGVAAGGLRVEPYGIISVSAGGRELYRREPPEPRALVAPSVAADMTALMKTAVETGTGRQAQMGRQLAGKTGTTSSNRDGWFVGFTSDLIAGVWMGRDDARPVAALAGGSAPARAFSAFMRRASGGRPDLGLQTEIASAEDFVEPDAEVWGYDGAGPGYVPDFDPATQASPPPPGDYGEVYDPGDPAAEGSAAMGGPEPAGEGLAPDERRYPPAPEPGSRAAEGRLDEEWLEGVLADAPPPPGSGRF